MLKTEWLTYFHEIISSLIYIFCMLNMRISIEIHDILRIRKCTLILSICLFYFKYYLFRSARRKTILGVEYRIRPFQGVHICFALQKIHKILSRHLLSPIVFCIVTFIWKSCIFKIAHQINNIHLFHIQHCYITYIFIATALLPLS